MFRKIILAFDSFKACLSSSEAAVAAERGVRSVCPHCETVRLALADGGEGTIDALAGASGAQRFTVRVPDPLGRPVEAQFALMPGKTSGGGSIALVESAQACGLNLLLPEERNPLLCSSRGLGGLLLAALERGAGEFLVTLGGSAVNDGGRGMMEVPGLREAMRGRKVTVACDVDNPFIGPRGASHVFAPQKGADARMVEQLEASMTEYARTIETLTGVDVRDMPGAGAAGGLGGAFAAFFGAELRSGIDIVLDVLGFDDMLEGADLVITGEGCSDAQTLMGKCAYGVLKRARSHGVPVLLVSGALKDTGMLLEAGFAGAVAASPAGTPLAEAMLPDVAARNIEKAVRRYLSGALS